MTAPSNPPIKIKFTTCVREPFAKTTKMADLKRLILECMRKVSPLLEKNDISLAEKYEAKAIIRNLLREMGRRRLSVPFKSVQGQLEEMLGVLDDLPVTLADQEANSISFKAKSISIKAKSISIKGN